MPNRKEALFSGSNRKFSLTNHLHTLIHYNLKKKELLFFLEARAPSNIIKGTSLQDLTKGEVLIA
jgi:hypothetical protein